MRPKVGGPFQDKEAPGGAVTEISPKRTLTVGARRGHPNTAVERCRDGKEVLKLHQRHSNATTESPQRTSKRKKDKIPPEKHTTDSTGRKIEQKGRLQTCANARTI